MKYLTFDQIKAQLRLDDEQAELERAILTTYGEAAEDAVLNVCNRTVTEMHSLYGDIPAGIIVTSLLLVDDMYNHRGTVTPQSVYHLPTFDINVKPYMKLTNNDEYGRHTCNL